jgi:hypothetical protein
MRHPLLLTSQYGTDFKPLRYLIIIVWRSVNVFNFRNARLTAEADLDFLLYGASFDIILDAAESNRSSICFAQTRRDDDS